MFSKRERLRFRLSFLSVVILILPIVLLGCSQGVHLGENNQNSNQKTEDSNQMTDSIQTTGELQYSIKDVDHRLSAAHTRFAFSLYEKLQEDEHGKNVFISPFSISVALAMTYNGADAETKEAMAEALSLQDMTLDDVNHSFKVLKNILEYGDPSVQLHIANSLWAREGYEFKEDFLKRNQDHYEALVTALDFNDPEASDMINGWVKEKTEGKIEDIVDDPIDPLTVMFLINAIYFKGDWSEPFEENRTRHDTFYLLDGSSIQHPLMSNTGHYEYHENETFQAIRLPYGDERMGMYIFLPNENTTLKKFNEQVNEENWHKWLSQFEKVEGEIRLPKFQIEYEKSLNNVLKDLGMGVAFDQKKADFGHMADIPPNLYIENVQHKTFIEVNEKGTEAAAVTSVEIKTTSAPLYDFQMTVNRPFFFAIYDEVTGTVLFMGSVVDPS